MESPKEQLIRATKEVKEAKKKNPFNPKLPHRPRRVFNNQSGWFEIDGKRYYLRSKWEKNYARYLAFMVRTNLIKDWEYESETFWFEGIKHGTNSYKIDFKVIANDGSISYSEVKGYLDAKSKTKIKRMAKYFPKVVLNVCDKKWFDNAGKQLSLQIPGWE